jgi:hypothetical protein
MHTNNFPSSYLIAGVGEGMGRTWKGGGGFFFNTATNKEGMLGQSDPSASAVTHCDLIHVHSHVMFMIIWFIRFGLFILFILKFLYFVLLGIIFQKINNE